MCMCTKISNCNAVYKFINHMYICVYVQVSSYINDNTNGLLAGQRASLREALVVLSENTSNDTAQGNAQRNELLGTWLSENDLLMIY